MNPLISIIAFVIAFLLVMRQIRVWKFRVFLSPGFYFGFLWAIGLLGVTILHVGGLLLETYPQFIDELNVYVAFTCLCFLFWTNKGRDSIQEEGIHMHFPWIPFKVLSVILFIAAVRELFRVDIGLSSMGEARANVHETLEGRSVLVGYAITSSMALSILAGYKLFSLLDKKVRISSITIGYLILPLISNLFLSIVVGGRVDFIYSFVYYIIGAAFYFPVHYSPRRRVIAYSAIGAIIALIFVSSVQSERSGHQDIMEIYLKEKSPVLGFFYGPIKYMSASYDGYQYRRVDNVDLRNLGYGRYTFNGFINWTIPFGHQLGLGDFSIAKSLNIYYNNQETYDYSRELYYTTHSGFIPIVKDFGIYGAFVCIFFLTFISHYFFVRIQRRKTINHCYLLFFFIIFLDYWIRMNYYGTLSSNVLMKLYPLLLVDLLDFFTKKQNVL